MLRRIQQTIHERNLIEPGAHLLVGVSGGADSTALLYALWFLADRMHFRVSAAHLHHGLRGRAADLDAAAVERLCARLGIPFYSGRADVPTLAQRAGQSFEMAARQARQSFFLDVKARCGAEIVAVAHTRDDQAETVLMRLLSGVGLAGLSGMAYASEPRPGLRVIRPLLDVSRREIESFLLRHRIPWREDATNRDPAYLRNRVRREILPFLADHGFPQAVTSLVRLAELAREENRVLERRTADGLRRCRDGENGLRLDRLAGLERADQRRVVRAWLSGGDAGERSIDFQLVERILRLAERGRGATGVGSDRTVEVARGRLRIRSNQKRVSAPLPLTAIAVPGETVVEGAGLVVRVTEDCGYRAVSQRPGQWPAVAYVARFGAPPVLFLRSRQPGDAYVPTGMSGRVSLKSLLINEKIPAGERASIPVLVAGKNIVWLAGYRVGRSFAVPSRRAPSWKIVIERMPA